jgi:allantoin racemase
MTMRILYLYPGPLSAVDGGREELERRQDILRSLAPPDVMVDVRDVTHGGRPPKGPVSFETAYEAFTLVEGAASVLEEAEAEGYDAAVLGCFGDPGLEALRERLSRLVLVGPGASSCHLATMLGETFGVVTTSSLFINPARRMVHALGLAERAVGIEVVDMPPRELARDPAVTSDRTLASIERLKDKGANAIVLGCMTLGFLAARGALKPDCGIPVVSPVTAAFQLSIALVRCGLKPSKAAYPSPTGKIF